MNSDKLDNYFKTEIGRLDQTRIPGTGWDQEASWDKIDRGVNGRKKFFIWWYLSGAAAAVLLLLAFWFLSTNDSMRDFSIAKNTDEKPILTPNIKADVIEEPFADQAEIVMPIAEPYKQAGEDKNAEATVGVGMGKSKSKIAVAELKYLPQVIQIGDEKIKALALTPIKTEKSQESVQSRDMAFNRTYIIRKNSTEMDAPQELKLRIDLAMKSDVDPPSGLLSNIRK